MGSDHGGGVLGGRDDVGALRVAILDGRVGVALDLVVGVHRGVVLLVEVQRHLAVALVDEDGFRVAVVVVVGAHRRADGRGGFHDERTRCRSLLWDCYCVTGGPR